MEPRIPRYVPVVNVVLKFLIRRGVKAGPVSIITVAGRRSGRPHSVPHVAVFEVTPAGA